MSIQVMWDDAEKTTIRQVFSGRVTLEDYIASTDQVEQMAKEVSHTVHSIMDRSTVTSTPGVVLPAMRYANSHVPPNLGMRVVVKGGSFTRVIVDIGRRVAPRLIHNIWFVDSLEEGRAIIAKASGRAEV